MKSGETKYILKSPLTYPGSDGQFAETDFFILREPTIHHAQKSLSLRQDIKRSEFELGAKVATLGLIDDDTGSKSGEQLKSVESLADQWLKDSEQIVSQVTMQLENSSVDLYKFAEKFWKMSYLHPSICLVAGEIGMKKGFRDNLSVEDFIGVPIFYCSFFVTLSGKDRKIISGGQSDSLMVED